MGDSNAGSGFASTKPETGDEQKDNVSRAVVADFDVEEGDFDDDVSQQRDRYTLRSEKKHRPLATAEEEEDDDNDDQGTADIINSKNDRLGSRWRVLLALIILSLLLICGVVVSARVYQNQGNNSTNGGNVDHQTGNHDVARSSLFAPDFRKEMGVANGAPVNLSWQLHDGNFTFELELADGVGGKIGWLGFGIADPYARKMAGADMAIVEGLGGGQPSSSWPVTITDMFSSLNDPHRRHEPPTTDLETVQNWHLLAVERHPSTLRVRITRTRTEGLDAVADRPLPYDDNVDTTLILAFGPDSQMPRHKGHQPTDRLRYSVNLETGIDDLNRVAAIKNRPGVKKTTIRFPLVGNITDWHLFVPRSRHEVLSEVYRQLNISEGSSMPLPVVLFTVAQAPPHHHIQLISCKRSGFPLCPYDYYFASVGVVVDGEGVQIEDGSAALIGQWDGDTFQCAFHGKVNGPIDSEILFELWIDTALNERLVHKQSQRPDSLNLQGEQQHEEEEESKTYNGSMNIFHVSETVRIPKYPSVTEGHHTTKEKKKNSNNNSRSSSPTTQATVLTSFVSSECTHKVMLRPIHIHSVHPHMHDTALRFAFSFRNRTGHEYAAVDSTAHDYASEFWRQFRRPIQVSPGDQFVIQCVFYPKTDDVAIQSGPHEEMCILATRTSPRSAWAPGGDKYAPFDFLCKENVTVVPLNEAKRQGMLLNYTAWQP